MTFDQAVRAGFQRFGDFAGRSSRAEFWWFTLFATLGKLLALGPGLIRAIGVVFSFVVLVPSISIAVRRLHDVNRSGWWLLLSLTGIGIIPLLYWWVQPGSGAGNDYGSPPE